jgi:hypothetical protein
MHQMQTYVEFRSDRFPACDREEYQTSFGVWGKRLADFLRDSLRAEGFETEDPYAEDWGWNVPIVNDKFRLWVGCSNYKEYPDGFCCYIEPHTAFVRRFFRKVDTRERITELQRALDKVLAETAGITAKRWWTHEEFVNQER